MTLQFGYKTLIVKGQEPTKLKLKSVYEDTNVIVYEDRRQKFTLITSPSEIVKAEWT